MGCRALLLLPFLSLGAATTIRSGLKTLGSLHLPTNPTSDPAVANNYSVLYFQQKVSGGWEVGVPSPRYQPPVPCLASKAEWSTVAHLQIQTLMLRTYFGFSSQFLEGSLKP